MTDFSELKELKEKITLNKTHTIHDYIFLKTEKFEYYYKPPA